MRKTSLALIAAVVFVSGCKGPEGPAGKNGAPGFPDTTTYKGSATSDTYTVSIPSLDVSKGDLISAYACSNSSLCEQLNIYQAGIPSNTAYLETPGVVTLSGLITAGLPDYIITVVTRH